MAATLCRDPQKYCKIDKVALGCSEVLWNKCDNLVSRSRCHSQDIEYRGPEVTARRSESGKRRHKSSATRKEDEEEEE